MSTANTNLKSRLKSLCWSEATEPQGGSIIITSVNVYSLIFYHLFLSGTLRQAKYQQEINCLYTKNINILSSCKI